MTARAKNIVAILALAGLAGGTAAYRGWGDNATAAGVSAAFAAAAWWLRGVDAGGAAAGACVAFVFFAQGGPRMFGSLLLVFVVTLAATRLGPRHGGRNDGAGRSASQIGANLLAATAVVTCQALMGVTASLLLLAILGELAGDTVSSEIGEAYGGRPYLVTTLRPVASGTDGAISLVGSLAGGAAIAGTVGLGALLLGLPDAPVFAVMGAAAIGVLTDSALGATLERRGMLSNDGVNLISTVAAGITCYLMVAV